jgi:hypothetical protein
MNVTPHINCGKTPDFQFIVKNYTSAIDVRYKESSDSGKTSDTLAVLDKNTHALSAMPKIRINNSTKEFTFYNIVPCKTPGGTEFLTAVDVCLDHAYGVAQSNYAELIKSKPAIQNQPVFHVVVSNCISITKEHCLSSDVMHVDPLYSKKGCKEGVLQQTNSNPILQFGKNLLNVYVLEPIRSANNYLKNNYAYKAHDVSSGRDHGSYTVTIFDISQKNSSAEQFNNFKNKYNADRGDFLKTKILEDFKKQIQRTSSKEDLEKLKETVKGSYEYDVLKKGQGYFTQVTGIKTSSLLALDDMFKQQEEYFKFASSDKALKH